MPSKGNPRVVVRLKPEEIELIEDYIRQLNSRRFSTPWTMASFLRSCVEERIAKINRGRAGKKAKAHPPALNNPQKGGDHATGD